MGVCDWGSAGALCECRDGVMGWGWGVVGCRE